MAAAACYPVHAASQSDASQLQPRSPIATLP